MEMEIIGRLPGGKELKLLGMSFPGLMVEGQSILIVDDVPEQCEIASTYLKKINYRVHARVTEVVKKDLQQAG